MIEHMANKAVRTTSTPRFRATAMTVFKDPKSIPTTDMFAMFVYVLTMREYGMVLYAVVCRLQQNKIIHKT